MIWDADSTFGGNKVELASDSAGIIYRKVLIMAENHERVCPVGLAWFLDNIIRRWIHNPRKILGGLVKEGMTVLDVGCGPGLFSVAMADMVGKSGKVIAADLQDGMLEKVKSKLNDTNRNIIKLHKCEEDKIGVTEKVDFVLVFYVLHEVPSQEGFLREIRSILNPAGRVLIIEPNFHVTKEAFEQSISTAISAGFQRENGPKVFGSRSIILKSF
jgi:ubiquinone/menaquinone biosynthesis C-methylase UbiE